MGTGEPWAGHVSSRGSFSTLRSEDIFVSVENLGDDPLIGSNKQFDLFYFLKKLSSPRIQIKIFFNWTAQGVPIPA